VQHHEILVRHEKEEVVKLYLVQHAEAMSKKENADRPITGAGRQATADVASMAAKLGLDLRQIRHSGKTRAEETAQILAEALAPPDGVIAVEGLGPLDDVEPVAVELAGHTEPVMLVGHLPFMERLASLLLTGDAERPVVRFTNAGIVCLSGDNQWQVLWIITPEIAAS
jgi:phosphohistidine phosphatase